MYQSIIKCLLAISPLDGLKSAFSPLYLTMYRQYLGDKPVVANFKEKPSKSLSALTSEKNDQRAFRKTPIKARAGW